MRRLLEVALLAVSATVPLRSASAQMIADHSLDQAPLLEPPRLVELRLQVDTPTTRAIEYSDAYGTRLTIHRIGSYTMIPLFAAEYMLGDRLLNGSSPAGWVRSTHGAVAGGVAALFAVNTVTGAWNLWDARRDPEGRTRRLLHSALMMASEAGFVATGVLSDRAGHSMSGASTHRNVALASMSLSTAGTLLMWLWKD